MFIVVGVVAIAGLSYFLIKSRKQTAKLGAVSRGSGTGDGAGDQDVGDDERDAQRGVPGREVVAPPRICPEVVGERGGPGDEDPEADDYGYREAGEEHSRLPRGRGVYVCACAKATISNTPGTTIGNAAIETMTSGKHATPAAPYRTAGASPSR